MRNATVVTLYLPSSQSRYVAAVIAPGAAIVSSDTMEDPMRIDYEGNLYQSTSMRRYADRAYHAADRQQSNYPTIARAFVRRDELVEIGTFDMDRRRVVLRDAAAEQLLGSWLGVDSVEEDELEAEKTTAFSALMARRFST